HGMEKVRVGLVDEESFLEGRLVVDMQREASGVESTWTSERAARFDFEHVVGAVAILVGPTADRIALIGGVDVSGPVAAVGEDSAQVIVAAEQDIGGFRR